MSLENPRYDVAISFLSKDQALAAALHQKLSEGLEVFFYPRNQEDLAGTDGLESMRKPFFDDSRLVVVLYREPWGKTPWTRVEEMAIKDSCLQYGWQRLLFMVLEKDATVPIWLPQSHIRFNYADFGFEQAVGAIKARVQENGGRYVSLTPLKRAQIFKADEKLRRAKARLNSSEGVEKILAGVADLFREIEKHCADISSKGLLEIKWGTDFNARSSVQTCNMTNGQVGLTVVWAQPYSNTLDGSSLVVREYRGGLILPSEQGQRIYLQQPRQLCETKYSPDLSPAYEYVWAQNNSQQEFVSSSSLAERCVIQFVELAQRYASGEMKYR